MSDESEALSMLAHVRTAIEKGRRLERAAIVADLRARAARRESWVVNSVAAEVLRLSADRYERGEHEEAT